MFGLTGTGYFDMTAYASYNSGTMTDSMPTDTDLETGLQNCQKFDRAGGAYAERLPFTWNRGLISYCARDIL